MPRYVAFLRGVSPSNAKMPELKRCFESAGMADVKTVLSSGNVVFTSGSRSIVQLQKDCEAAMTRELGRAFPTIVRPLSALKALLASDPFAKFKLPPETKRVVTFLRERQKSPLKLPIKMDGARILATDGTEVFTAYVPSEKGPVFMTLIEKTFSKDVTTRTWDTVKKCAAA